MKTLTIALTSFLMLCALSVPVVNPCTTEDGTLCNWNADTRGNGKGSSFIALTDDWKVNY